MATTESRARMLCHYAKRGVENSIEWENCATMISRIDWGELRMEDPELYEDAYTAAEKLGFAELLARVRARFS